MRVLVAVKRCLDAASRVRLRPDGRAVDVTGAPLALNPFDAIALEEAVRLRERGLASEVLAITVEAAPEAAPVAPNGPAAAAAAPTAPAYSGGADVLRSALALGADRAVRVAAAGLREEQLQPLLVAKVLAGVAAQESIDLVLMGKQAIDGDNGQTGQMLAGLLRWPQAINACRIDIVGDAAAAVAQAGPSAAGDARGGRAARVTCEADSGPETHELLLPAVITVDLRLNVPRFAGLSAQLRAKKAAVGQLDAAVCARGAPGAARGPAGAAAAGGPGPRDGGSGEDAVDLAASAQLEVVTLAHPPPRPPGVRVGSVAELFAKLRERGAL